MAPDRAAHRRLGRRRGARTRRPPPAVHLHRRRPEAVDLRVPRRGRADARPRAPPRAGAAARWQGPAVNRAQLPGRAGTARVHQRSVLVDRHRRAARGRIPVHRPRPVSGGDAGGGQWAADSAWPPRTRRPPRGSSPRRWRGSSRTARCATARPACRGASVPATSPSSSGRARAIARSRRRSKHARFPPTSTRASGSSTPTK